MIQWTTGDNDGGVNGLGGTAAQVGINRGDGVEAVIVNGSRANDITDIFRNSNVGVPGVFIFDISEGIAPVGKEVVWVLRIIMCVTLSKNYIIISWYLL